MKYYIIVDLIYIYIPRSSTYALFLPLMVLPWISAPQCEFCPLAGFLPLAISDRGEIWGYYLETM